MNNDFKVIHLSTDDKYGAGKAACRISEAQKQLGVDSVVLTLNSFSNCSQKIKENIFTRSVRRILKKLNWSIVRCAHPKALFHYDLLGSSSDIIEYLSDADIINLHWINDGIWSRNFVRELIKLDKPIVWTMHDMWAYTAGCHYDEFCGRYKSNCKKCPILSSVLGSFVSDNAYKLKEKAYKNLNITLVGCSKWIANEASKSALCRDYSVHCLTIHNPIDAELYKFVERKVARDYLGINTSKKIILFGAVYAMSDMRKGFQYLYECIKGLDTTKYLLMVFGTDEVNHFSEFEAICMGKISDEKIMTMIYNAADVFVAPSIQENLANTVLESLSCGTPVVAFDVGGMKDMIISDFNGKLVEPYDVLSLRDSIDVATSKGWNREAIVDDIKARFSKEIIGQQYCDLYNKILKKENHYEDKEINL